MLRALESSPLDSGTSTKIYARDVGPIFDSGLELQPAAGR